MKYEHLQDLIQNSSSSRQYFLSLPVDVQMALHSQNEYIKTAAQLHKSAELVSIYQRQEELGSWNVQ